MRFECNSLAEFYTLIPEVLLSMPAISPRGNETKEIVAPQVLINNPRARLVDCPGRNFSIPYAVVESLLLVSGTNKLKYFEALNQNMINYSDDGVTLYGAYGYRIAHSVSKVIKKLNEDNASRQAVLPIMRIKDISEETKDVPCTLGLHFLIRDNKLNLIVYMRSNDVIWGLPYDVYMFTTLQEIIANNLKVELGWYLHCTSSLHVYKKHYELLEGMIESKPVLQLNECKLVEWIMLAEWYRSLIDDKYSDKDLLTKHNKSYADIIARKLSYNVC